MVHLLPLPGAPGWQGDMDAVTEAALADASALATGGVGALMVENFHDVPFYPETVPAATVAAMTVLARAIRWQNPDLPLGINVLRNDAAAALGIACATGAGFVRVNVHAGAAVTDQGLIHGQAHHTVRLRQQWEPTTGILADVRVKHAQPLAERPLAAEASDLRERGLADGLVFTGPATGRPARPEDLQVVRQELPDCPLLVGSGMTADLVPRFAPWADGYIVGSSLKQATVGARANVSAERVAHFVAAVRAAASATGRE